MKSMKPIFDQYDKLIEASKCHIRCAMECKDDPVLSKLYQELAANEHVGATKIYNYAVEQGTTVDDPEEAQKILEQMWTEKQSSMAEELAMLKAHLGMLK